jgi:peptide deformylase
MAAPLEIRYYPDPVLRKLSVPVSPQDTTIPQLVTDLFATLEGRGIGLAAPQVGILKRVVVVDLGPEYSETLPLALINPEITWRSEETSACSNGCLSFPGFWEDVVRPEEIVVAYQDVNFRPQSLKAQGLLAVCIQHEIDHLDGILFIDHLSKLKRASVIRRFKKQIAEGLSAS